MRRRLAPGALALAVLALAVPVLAGAATARTAWRLVATADDRERLRNWRDAWGEGFAAVRSRDGAAAMAGDRALFDPDGALDRPLPPAGAYRCRTVKLGDRGVATGGWGGCAITPAGGLLRLARLDGEQRFAGLVYDDSRARGVFLGAGSFADERRPAGYGRAAGRDMAGWVERIGDRRWRIVLPYPYHESRLDVVELVPAT